MSPSLSRTFAVLFSGRCGTGPVRRISIESTVAKKPQSLRAVSTLTNCKQSRRERRSGEPCLIRLRPARFIQVPTALSKIRRLRPSRDGLKQHRRGSSSRSRLAAPPIGRRGAAPGPRQRSRRFLPLPDPDRTEEPPNGAVLARTHVRLGPAPARFGPGVLLTILPEDHSNSRTAQRAAAEGGALRASLTSNGLQAPLRQDKQGEMTQGFVSYVLSPDRGWRFVH